MNGIQARVGAGPMTDPALDGPDAEAAIGVIFDSVGLNPEQGDETAALAALNEQGVVLCDEHALAELRQQAKASEALADDLLTAAGEVGDAVLAPAAASFARIVCRRHGLGASR